MSPVHYIIYLTLGFEDLVPACRTAPCRLHYNWRISNPYAFGWWLRTRVT